MSEFGIKTLALLQTAATAACQTVLTEDIQFNVQRLTEKIEKHVSQIHKTNQRNLFFFFTNVWFMSYVLFVFHCSLKAR